MLYPPTFRISPDAPTPFSSRIRRTRRYDSNPCMADVSAASESVFITVLLACPSQREWFWIGPHAEYDKFFG